MQPKIPGTIQIQGMQWTIMIDNVQCALEGAGAFMSSRDCTITLADTLPLDRQRKSFLHELVHATCDEILVEDLELREVQVYALSTALFQVLNDNPEARGFIFGET